MLSRSRKLRRLGTPLLCCAATLAAGCQSTNVPRSEAGVRATYRSIGIDASTGAFEQICRTYTDQQLRAELSPFKRNCYTRAFERWAERIRLSKITARTRIFIRGGEALVYDGAAPERLVYAAGEWRLANVPELATPR